MAKKKGKKWPFFGPGGPNFDPFSRFLSNDLYTCANTSYQKIRKNHSLEKIPSPKNCENGRKWSLFCPGGPNFKPFFTIFCK